MALLSWMVAKFTGAAIKGGAEIAKSVCEVPKTVIETEKARLEVLALKTQREVRENLIVAATFQDVKEFDPMYSILQQRIGSDLHKPLGRTLRSPLHLLRPLTNRSVFGLEARRQPIASLLRVFPCQIRRSRWSAQAFRGVIQPEQRWTFGYPLIALGAGL